MLTSYQYLNHIFKEDALLFHTNLISFGNNLCIAIYVGHVKYSILLIQVQQIIQVVYFFLKVLRPLSLGDEASKNSKIVYYGVT